VFKFLAVPRLALLAVLGHVDQKCVLVGAWTNNLHFWEICFSRGVKFDPDSAFKRCIQHRDVVLEHAWYGD
jgi:hypothetical protein